jgi:hypothetical protein
MVMSDILTPGRLEDQPFPALAGRIFREGRTGGLALESGGRRRTVWFLGGNPVAVVSEDPGDHLARFLLEHGRIDDSQYARLLTLPETRGGIARADFLPKEALNWGVKFRFVHLCYDLFRWEEGDFVFEEGSPPRDLFLLKVPARALIVKGVANLGRGRLLDLAPDDALLAPGEVAPEQARYLGPDEHRLLEACVPGSTVADVLASSAGDPEQTRALVYALSCLGLVSLAPSRPFRAPEEDDAAFALEEPAAAAAEVASVPEGRGGDDAGFELPTEDVGTAAATATDLEAALAEATRGERFPVPETPAAGPVRSFDESFSAEGADEPPPPLRRQLLTKIRKAPVAQRESRLPRLAGIALGAVGASAIIGAAAWWWLGGEEPQPPVPLARVVPPAPPTPAAQPQQVAPAPAPPVVPPLATAPVPVAAPSQAVLTDRYRNGLGIFRAGDLDGAAAIWEDVLALDHRDEFTVLLLTACQQDTVRDIQKALANRRLFLVPRQVKGRNCFRVCVDTFGSRDAATRALASLPSEFRAAGAAVRPVADVLSNR